MKPQMNKMAITLRASAYLIGLSLLFWGNITQAQQLPNLPLPIYGNWCGPDHPRGFANARPPIDLLDSACMRHDYCIAAQGDFDCGCDITFLTELRNARWNNPYIQKNARGVYDAIALTPCQGASGTAFKQSMFMKDLFYDSITGRGTPMDVIERWRSLVIKK